MEKWILNVMGHSLNPYGKFSYTRDFTHNEHNFPNQLANSYLWIKQGDFDYSDAVGQFITKFARLENPRDKFLLDEPDDWTIEQMASTPLQISFLDLLIQVLRVKRILEIGTFVGLSAMHFANAMSPDGKVISIEKYSKFSNIAKQNIKRNGLEGRIEVIQGDFLELVASQTIRADFDLIFIDGGKESYKKYLEASFNLLAEDGVVVMDDIFFWEMR